MSQKKKKEKKKRTRKEKDQKKKPAAASKKPMKVMKERKANVAPETQVRKTFDEEDEDLLEFDTLNDQLSKSVREFESSQEVYNSDKAWDDMIAAQKKLVEFSRSAISRKWTLNRRMLMARNELDGVMSLTAVPSRNAIA